MTAPLAVLTRRQLSVRNGMLGRPLVLVSQARHTIAACLLYALTGFWEQATLRTHHRPTRAAAPAGEFGAQAIVPAGTAIGNA